jgi:DNA-binding MarR family transcriptional regulator
VTVPRIGERYRGVEGYPGYLLRQAAYRLRPALDKALRPHRITGVQYGVLSILARDPGASGADLARGCSTTPQAMNGVLANLGREGLVERRPHPTHGRILQVTLTPEGERRLEAARPEVLRLEADIERDFSGEEMAVVKRWLVGAAERLEARATGDGKRVARAVDPE